MHSCFLTIPGAPSSQSAVRVRLSGVADSRGSVSDGFVRTVGVPDRDSAGTRSAVDLPFLKHLSCTPGLQESVQRRSWWRSMFGGRGGRSGIQERDARHVGRQAGGRRAREGARPRRGLGREHEGGSDVRHDRSRAVGPRLLRVGRLRWEDLRHAEDARGRGTSVLGPLERGAQDRERLRGPQRFHRPMSLFTRVHRIPLLRTSSVGDPPKELANVSRGTRRVQRSWLDFPSRSTICAYW